MEISISNTKLFTSGRKAAKVKWAKEEDEKLKQVVLEFNNRNWGKIAETMGSKSSIQCFHRYQKISRMGLKKGGWTKEEDDQLLEHYSRLGEKWSMISGQMKTRTANQIRERYKNILAEGINKTRFTAEEDELIIKLYNEFGKAWTKIASFFNNRTPERIKTRFYTNIIKKIVARNEGKKIRRLPSLKKKNFELKFPSKFLFYLLVFPNTNLPNTFDPSIANLVETYLVNNNKEITCLINQQYEKFNHEINKNTFNDLFSNLQTNNNFNNFVVTQANLWGSFCKQINSLCDTLSPKYK